MRVAIEASDLPGRSCEPPGAGQRYENIHVGVQRGREPFQLIRGDAPSAAWSFDVGTKTAADGATDFTGPFVQGKRGDRFVYLTWGAVNGDAFHMFRRAKLHFADIDADVLRAALDGAELVARLGLTDGAGAPLCARVRPPAIEWTTRTAG